MLLEMLSTAESWGNKVEIFVETTIALFHSLFVTGTSVYSGEVEQSIAKKRRNEIQNNNNYLLNLFVFLPFHFLTTLEK